MSTFLKEKVDDKKIKEDLIRGITEEIRDAIYSDRIVIIREDFDLLEKILERICEYKNDNNRQKYLDLYENKVSEVLRKLYENKNIEYILIGLNYLNSVYEKCNKLNECISNKIYLNIFDKVSKELFEGVARLVEEKREDFYLVMSLELNLYNNLDFEYQYGRIVCKNNSYVVSFSSRIYYEIKRNNKQEYSRKELYDIKKRMYEHLETLIKYTRKEENTKNKIEIMYRGLSIYTKTLIDNMELDVFSNVFLDKLKNFYSNYDRLSDEYYITIMIYLYYLIEVEYLVTAEEKEKLSNLLKKYNEIISNYLNYYCRINWDNNTINKINNILETWEKMPKEGAKSILMDYAIDQFMLFYSLKKFYLEEEFTKSIKELVNGKEISIYKRILSGELIEKYNSFKKLFYDDDYIEEEIELLKETILKIYKENELKKVDDAKKNPINYEEISEKIKEITLNSYEEKLNIFEKKDTLKYDIKSIKRKLIIDIYYDILKDFIKEGCISEQIRDRIEFDLICIFISLLYNNVSKVEIEENRNLVNFLNEINNLDFEVDTIIGNINTYRKEDIKSFNELKRGKNILRNNYINNALLAIDGKKIYLELKKVDVLIEDIDFEIEKNMVNKNKDGLYIYKINDIEILYSEEEFKKYLIHNKKKIILDIDIDYSIENAIVGCGLFELN
ncbi:hypothetical protein [Peptacetobacter hiranonis]|uniref:hypothetical protein n=1 Tax=Peptacetobacter hiranonis TaxID=89152 RepID=UPI0022E09930|nr:hypothetical protein [Peptacetobacter hiranonis]